jgi:type II secretory pathway component PulF
VPVFSYTALDPAARRVRGRIRADSPRQARALLLGRGVRPTDLTAQADGAEAPGGGIRGAVAQAGRRLLALRQRERVLDALENLLTLLESHVPLEAAWDGLVRPEATNGRRAATRGVPDVLLHLHEAVRLGRPLWAAMAERPAHFDAADVAIVRAGEEAGELAAALARLVARRQMAGRLLSTLAGALAYPAFLLVFGTAVVLFLTTRVLPNLTAMLAAAGGEVPLATRALMAAGRALAWGVLPAGCGLAVLLVALTGRGGRARQFLWAWAARVPVVGAAWRHWQLAQFCLVLRTLVASGVHLPAALPLAGQAAGGGAVGAAAAALRARLLEGHDLADGGYDNGGSEVGAGNDDRGGGGEGGGGFPPWLWRALAVGQATGDLVPVLERVGVRFEAAAAKSAARLAAAAEPAMILLIGLVVGLIAYGALLPIVKLGGAL